MKLSDVNWKHLVAGALIAASAFLAGQHGGLSALLANIGNSIADFVGGGTTS